MTTITRGLGPADTGQLIRLHSSLSLDLPIGIPLTPSFLPPTASNLKSSGQSLHVIKLILVFIMNTPNYFFAWNGPFPSWVTDLVPLSFLFIYFLFM